MAKKAAAKPENKVESTKKSVLKQEISLPGKGRLNRKARAPKWLRAIGGYFAGSWRELREVRWPTRRATLVLTLAVIVFTAVMVAFILALDFGFEQLFKRILL